MTRLPYSSFGWIFADQAEAELDKGDPKDPMVQHAREALRSRPWAFAATALAGYVAFSAFLLGVAEPGSRKNFWGFLGVMGAVTAASTWAMYHGARDLTVLELAVHKDAIEASLPPVSGWPTIEDIYYHGA